MAVGYLEIADFLLTPEAVTGVSAAVVALAAGEMSEAEFVVFVEAHVTPPSP